MEDNRQSLVVEINYKLHKMGRKLDNEKLNKLTYNDLVMLKKEIDEPVMKFSSYEEMQQHLKAAKRMR